MNLIEYANLDCQHNLLLKNCISTSQHVGKSYKGVDIYQLKENKAWPSF
jgi:hypothetical protein